MPETAFEARCAGDCHTGPYADFDHYCDSAGIKPGEEGPAFAAWLNAISGWDGPAGRVETTCVYGHEEHSIGFLGNLLGRSGQGPDCTCDARTSTRCVRWTICGYDDA